MNLPLLNLKFATGGSLVADMLNALGIEYLFTIPGSQTLPIMHGISKRSNIKIIVSRSERNSVFMAEGYGRATGFPAVTLSTLGPGLANELPALYSATKNNSPLLSISPFHPPWKISRLGEVFQGFHHPEFLKSIVKKNYIVNEIEELSKTITNSFQKCLEEPKGPVHIDISFPILFRSYLYFSFKKNNMERKSTENLYIIYEKSDFIKFSDLIRFTRKTNMLTELLAGESSGTLPFAIGVKLGVKKRHTIAVVSLDNVLVNLDSLVVATANGIAPVIISFRENSKLQRIAEVFRIEYKYVFSYTFLEKSNTLYILVVD